MIIAWPKSLNHGRARTALLCQSLWVLLIASAAFANGQTQSPCQPPAIPISSEQNIFTEEQEADLGDVISEHIQREWRILEEEHLKRYLNAISERLIKQLPPTRLRYRFLIVDLPAVTAFVLPGGRVYVSRKLISFVQSEDELAGVIAHELGHLIARHGSVGVSRMFREVLGVTSVGDRKDILDKYNQLVENAARKPKAFQRKDSHEQRDQVAADYLGLYAVAAAGYDPSAHVSFFDRLAETKGKTGGFFSDLFGTTRPESRRLRELIRTVSTLPASCIEARRSADSDEFERWRASVVNYTGLGRRESLHSVLAKITLDPPLRSEVSHLRFSPDGKYVLAQDDAGISVLSREPFASIFRIDSAEAHAAQFTPDSSEIVFHNSNLRIERWSVETQSLESASELFVRESCVQTALSPEGRTFACLDWNFDLNLFDVASGTRIFQKKQFHSPDLITLLLKMLDGDADGIEWVNLRFSPDGRYFLAGASSRYFGITGNLRTEVSSAGFDVANRQPFAIRGSLKKLLSNAFTFQGNDRLIAADPENLTRAKLVSFPGGEVIKEVHPVTGRMTSATRGEYLIFRSRPGTLSVMDLSTGRIIKGSRQPAMDFYDDVFVAERVNGEIGLFGVEKNNQVGKVFLSDPPLGKLRASALSSDLRWLAVSGRMRGAVWDLSSGERLFHVRGFRGGHFGEGSFYADFPRFEETERNLARFDLARREIDAGPQIADRHTTQHGRFVVTSLPKHDVRPNFDVTLEVRDTESDRLLWTKRLEKEAPTIWVSPHAGTMVLGWPVQSDAAKSQIKNDPVLSSRLRALKEKDGDHLLQILDAATGSPRGSLLIETGKGSFRIVNATALRDRVVVSDSENRVLLYSLANGELKGRFFGDRPVLSPDGELLCVENEPGRLLVYDANSMEKRDEFIFSYPVALAGFSPDGKRLLVLTANQTVYFLGLSSR